MGAFKAMILEIILICGFCILLAIGTIWFALRIVRIAVKEAKPNLTINFNQADKKPEFEEIQEILRSVNFLTSRKEILQIEQKSKNNED